MLATTIGAVNVLPEAALVLGLESRTLLKLTEALEGTLVAPSYMSLP